MLLQQVIFPRETPQDLCPSRWRFSRPGRTRGNPSVLSVSHILQVSARIKAATQSVSSAMLTLLVNSNFKPMPPLVARSVKATPLLLQAESVHAMTLLRAIVFKSDAVVFATIAAHGTLASAESLSVCIATSDMLGARRALKSGRKDVVLHRIFQVNPLRVWLAPRRNSQGESPTS